MLNSLKEEKIWFCSEKDCKRTVSKLKYKTNSELKDLYVKCNDCWQKNVDKNGSMNIKITRWEVNTEVYSKCE